MTQSADKEEARVLRNILWSRLTYPRRIAFAVSAVAFGVLKGLQWGSLQGGFGAAAVVALLGLVIEGILSFVAPYPRTNK